MQHLEGYINHSSFVQEKEVLSYSKGIFYKDHYSKYTLCKSHITCNLIVAMLKIVFLWFLANSLNFPVVLKLVGQILYITLLKPC